MDVVETRVGMPLDQFLEESSRQRFELINGEKVLLIPTLSKHAKLLKFFYDAIMRFLSDHPIGEVFQEATFILPDEANRNWVRGSRIPDILFLTNSTWSNYENSPLNADNLLLAFIPELVVEIISPTDKYVDVNNKVSLYLDDGVRMVWVVDYLTKRVSVFTHDDAQFLGSEDTLTGGDVLPGFEIKLSSLFVD
jgi:Uma2 family endonuclease